VGIVTVIKIMAYSGWEGITEWGKQFGLKENKRLVI
jgi:hypothetical protein